MAHRGFTLIRPPVLNSGVVIASPHSGRAYSQDFLQRSILSDRQIRSSEDAFVDHLIEGVESFGAPLLLATAPRAYVDLNRSSDELDPALIEGVNKVGHNPRIASGLGVIPRVVANGRAIYRGKLTMGEAQERLAAVWYPYHRQLNGLLAEAHSAFGQAILVDMHSMPREALDGAQRAGQPRPNVVIGDRFGASAHAEIIDRIEAAFTTAGFEVARNTPFAGAYITQTYGRPSRGQHAVQIEIDRSLYMDEARLTPLPAFAEIRRAIRQALSEVADIGRPITVPLAAE